MDYSELGLISVTFVWRYKYIWFLLMMLGVGDLFIYLFIQKDIHGGKTPHFIFYPQIELGGWE